MICWRSMRGRTEARTARAVLASGRAASRTSATALVADVDDCSTGHGRLSSTYSGFVP